MTAEPYRFDEFVIESVIGEGGMGKVFRARQVALDRWVALKVLARAQDKTFIDRFYREARSAARLVHPNIIQIHTVGAHQGIPYFAMEYIEGADLQNILAAAPEGLTNDEIGEITRSVVKALAVAMEHGIVHRDIKPANIMVTKGGLVKVMDFGLAKNRSSDLGLTQSGLVVGTPSYMSPEQGASRPVDTRSDLYSMGCVMYECICGRVPFNSDNVASLIYKHMYEMPEPPSKLGKAVSPELESICLKMLTKDPAERFQSPAEVLELLSKVPLNSSFAEMSLARRAMKIAEERLANGTSAEKVNVTSADFLGAEVPSDLMAGFMPPPSTLPPPPGPPAPVASAKRAPSGTFLEVPPAAPPTQAPSRRLDTPPPSPRSPEDSSSRSATPVPTTRRIESGSIPVPASRGSNTRLPTGGDDSRKSVSKIHSTFLKLPDGLWSYKPELAHCNFAEGLAAALPAPLNDKPGNLGDCLLCSNWNKRLGCVLGYNQELESRGRVRGLKLLSEQAVAWCGAGRFEKAIALLDNYVKNNPEDPEGFRELAFIYERPDYRSKDKRRSIVLYQRFLELARKSTLFSHVEIARVEERVAALSTAPAPAVRTTALMPGNGFPFQCFYRGPAAATCFAFGSATLDQIVVAHAGEVEPESGITAAQMSGALGLATTMFRRLKSEQARKDEQSTIKTELTRLIEMPIEDLARDPSLIVNIVLNQITSATMSVDQAVGTRCITIKVTSKTHQLLFTEAHAFKADQCHELLRRNLKPRS